MCAARVGTLRRSNSAGLPDDSSPVVRSSAVIDFDAFCGESFFAAAVVLSFTRCNLDMVQ